jgi:hypothetical protein
LIKKLVIEVENVPASLLSNLQRRDSALWVRTLPSVSPAESVVAFIGLPWRLVLMEDYYPFVVTGLQNADSISSSATRQRGFVQIIDTDPSRIELPQRCLPIYLLSGRKTASTSDSGFESRLRRLTMLEELRRSGIRELVIVSEDQLLPPELTELWAVGFRSALTFASDDPGSPDSVRDWLQRTTGISAVTFVRSKVSAFLEHTVEAYNAIYPPDRHVIRLRDRLAQVYQVDITELDEPERPIMEAYEVIEERDLKPIAPEDLTEGDFVSFFQDPYSSWRPYAAGLPWLRDPATVHHVLKCLEILNAVGPEASSIAYIASESGAGGTTLARALAWECARRGYPVLIAKDLPFVPEALPVANFLRRVHAAGTLQRNRDDGGELSEAGGSPGLYEVPWLVVFDTVHWQQRDAELVRFRDEMLRSGRPVCLLVVTASTLALSFYNSEIFKKVAELNHAIQRDETLALGHHLNRFLRRFHRERTDDEWLVFYREHTVRYLEGVAAFWVTLAFWIQGQYDLTESIQEWMYRSFKANANDAAVQQALLEIAALSTERIPLPERLLPPPKGEWPLSQLLDDARASFASLGLIRIAARGERYWALVHDVLGRFLITALFYDFAKRTELGFPDAQNAEHLRFLLLRQIAHKPLLGERPFRAIGEEFATSIFKIDPDHGRASFAPLWRDVLASLDAMPRSLRDTSRVFRHHTAVSRRRIATLDERSYGVTIDVRRDLLLRAIEDIQYALTSIKYEAGSEPNLNLFNSLANAYFDLAKLETVAGAPRERIEELKRLANDATRSAYDENPSNSFVIETYVKNLLLQAEEDQSGEAIARCIDALGILFSALGSSDAAYRASQLGTLADQALSLLFRKVPADMAAAEPTNARDVLVSAWVTLAKGRERWSESGLAAVPEADRQKALSALSHPAGRGNMQVIRLTYDLIATLHPYKYDEQLRLLDQLVVTAYRVPPQLRLDHAILLFQNSRHVEGEKAFRSLRQLWRESEQFVHIPERLRWLRSVDNTAVRVVHALVGSEQGHRAMARVQEFSQILVPFRPEEHGMRDVRPGTRFTCHVSFGHNGPFLRPVTAQPAS